MQVQEQLRDLGVTSRNWKDSELIDLKQQLIRSKKQRSIFRKVITKLLPRRYKFSLEDLISKQHVERERHLERRRLQLIDDPIYVSALPQKKRRLVEKVSDYTRWFKVIQPQNTWLICWNALICLVILYYFFEIALVVFFGEPVWQAQLQSVYTYFFNVFAIFILYCDIIVQMNTGYYKEGILIMNKLRIVKHYLRKYSLIDLMGVLVVTISFFTGDMALNYFKVLFYFKIVTLNNIDILFQKMLVFYLNWNIVYLIVRQILIVLVSTHYLGVIFFGIDHYIYSNNYYGPSTPAHCWIFSASAYSQLIFQPWYVWYVYSIYFALGTMTTIAYGDITPTNPIDTMYVIFVLVVCCIQFSYILYNIIEILLMGRAAKSEQDNQFLQVRKFMKNKLIPSKLQVRIKAFMEETWSSEMYRNRLIEKEMAQRLPKQLRVELHLQIYDKFAAQLIAFKFPQPFIKDLVQKIQEFRCSKEELVISNQEELKYAYYVTDGKVDFYLNRDLYMSERGETPIGIVEFFTNSKPFFNVRTTTHSNLYRIQLSEYQSLMRSKQVYIEIMRQVADECRIQARMCELFNLKCFVCDSDQHLCRNCPNIQYICNSKYIQIKYKNQNQQRQKTGRRYRKRERIQLSRNRKQSVEVSLQKLEPYNIQPQHLNQIQIEQDIDFSNLQQVIAQTQSILNQVREVSDRDAEKGSKYIPWESSTLRNFGIYFEDYNVCNVLKKIQ